MLKVNFNWWSVNIGLINTSITVATYSKILIDYRIYSASSLYIWLILYNFCTTFHINLLPTLFIDRFFFVFTNKSLSTCNSNFNSIATPLSKTLSNTEHDALINLKQGSGNQVTTVYVLTNLNFVILLRIQTTTLLTWRDTDNTKILTYPAKVALNYIYIFFSSRE